MSRLSERLSEIPARMAPVQAWLAPRIERGRHWLIAPREPLTWAALRSKLTTLKLPDTYAGRLAVLGVIVLLLLPVLFWYAAEQKDDKGAVTYPHASLINPILGGLGALFLIYAAIRQARTASAQAQTASDRHQAQTKADVQRRITETFSKAVEQLGSEKMEVRVGGIYTLERLAHEVLVSQQGANATADEGHDLYWTVMETLTAFVRERARWNEPDAEEMASAHQPATDIAAVLAVIVRRTEVGLNRERSEGWGLDLRGADLRGGADLEGAHLEGAYLWGARLEGAYLKGAYLKGAYLEGTHLEGADLREAHLEGANLSGAHLERAHLSEAHLERAVLHRAHLEGAVLRDAHLEVAHLGEAHLARAELGEAHLAGADLREAHLAGADLFRAHLERAHLSEAHLERADLREAHLAGADLREAHLERAHLSGAHLERADLRGAHLENAELMMAYLEGADLFRAHLEGADLSEAHLEGAHLSVAIGDAKTRLSEGVARPTGWPAYAPD